MSESDQRYDWFAARVDEVMGFLVTECGFEPIRVFQQARDLVGFYQKGGLFVIVIYEGTYWVYLATLRRKDLSSVVVSSPALFERIKLYEIWPLEGNLTVQDRTPGTAEAGLCYQSRLLKDNPEVLNGDLRSLRFSLAYCVRWFRRTIALRQRKKSLLQ